MAAPAKNNKRVHVIVTYEIKEDKIVSFIASITSLVAATNKEQGCIHYNLYPDTRSKNKFVMIEEWDNQENLTKHLQQAHLKTFRDITTKEEVYLTEPNVNFCGGPVIQLE